MYVSFKQMVNMKEVPKEGIVKGGIEEFPLGIGITATRYIDPFVGAGKTFYSVMTGYNMESAVICDESPELINFYAQMKKHPEELIEMYLKYEDGLDDRDFTDRQKYVRSCLKRADYIYSKSEETRRMNKAAVYCFAKNYNYLLKVRLVSGVTNQRDLIMNPLFCGHKPLSVLAEILQKTTIIQGRFTECLNYVNGEAIIRIAPPEKSFTDSDALKSFVKIAKGLGAQIVYH